jgi:hypothetical protein
VIRRDRLTERVDARPVLHHGEIGDGRGALQARREVHGRADAHVRGGLGAKGIRELRDAHQLGDPARAAHVRLQDMQRAAFQEFQRSVPVGQRVECEGDVEFGGQRGVPIDVFGGDGHLEEADPEPGQLTAAASA